MKSKVLVIAASPKRKKGNSESIADYFVTMLNDNDVTNTKVSLHNEIKNPEALIKKIDQSDYIAISFPVYENGVPGLVLEFFEMLYAKKDKLETNKRKMIVFSNSGFPEPGANRCAIAQCRLFAENMQFEWVGGASIAPGTLIDGKKLDDTGGTYKKVIIMLKSIAEKISTNERITDEWKLTSKPFIPPCIYRIAGRLINKGVIKKIGKSKYYSTPLINL